ncbi:synaptic vesicle 2-related protein [Caerostris extrusa]|uniref:Synaptic vesicle 2-related protein n=1 Tax=Caerostris extrusa TaxID=172846 RepID=A0AAV4X7U5_CAEEX|nr:synaptic vesicle 2-related protein [Caerostris extrusa]
MLFKGILHKILLKKPRKDDGMTLCSEFIPGRYRGRFIFILSCFFAVGVILMLGILYATTRPGHFYWRLFTAIATVPSLIAMIMMRFFPESIRFLLVNEEYVSARCIADEMSSENRKPLPRGQLFPVRNAGKRGNCCRLLEPIHMRSTLLFWYMGIAAGISYYFLIEVSSLYLNDVQSNIEEIHSAAHSFMGNLSQPVECLKNITDAQYLRILWTNALDFPGFVVFMIVVDVMDRKKLLCASCLLCSLFIFLLFLPNGDLVMRAGFLFCARTLLLGEMNMLHLMTAEAYPTTERGIAVGMQTVALYVGFFVTPYVEEGLLMLGVRWVVGFSAGGHVPVGDRSCFSHLGDQRNGTHGHNRRQILRICEKNC